MSCGPVTFQSATGIIAQDDRTRAQIIVGATVPSDGTAGYARGCLFIKNVSNGIGSTLYVNEGTESSCDFNAK